MDDSTVTGTVLSTAFSSCVATDASESATVARNHFPSEILPPAASRAVAKGEPWWETHRALPPTVDGSELTLLALRRYLHSLQDSWSHQGKPDIPLSCDPGYAWGHSLERGGWSCYLADLTYKWVDPDVMPVAHATYDALVVAYGKKPKQAWDQLKGPISDFARLDNKSGKAKWLEQRGVPKTRDIAFATSLTTCPSGPPKCGFDYFPHLPPDRLLLGSPGAVAHSRSPPSLGSRTSEASAPTRGDDSPRTGDHDVRCGRQHFGTESLTH